MREEVKAKVKTAFKKVGLVSGGLVTSLAPLGTYIGVNYKHFVDTTPKLVSLTVGGIVAVVFLAIAMLGKIKSMVGENKSLITYGVIFIVCLVLEPIMAYAKWISAMLLLGQAVNAVTFSRWLKKLETSEIAPQKAILQSTAKTETKSNRIGGI